MEFKQNQVTQQLLLQCLLHIQLGIVHRQEVVVVVIINNLKHRIKMKKYLFVIPFLASLVIEAYSLINSIVSREIPELKYISGYIVCFVCLVTYFFSKKVGSVFTLVYLIAASISLLYIFDDNEATSFGFRFGSIQIQTPSFNYYAILLLTLFCIFNWNFVKSFSVFCITTLNKIWKGK